MANNQHPKEKPTGDGNPTAGSANNGANCPTGHGPCKAFANLRAAFAMRGHALHRTDPADGPVAYWVDRWGMVRYLPTLDTARRFLEQIGGRL